MLNVEDAVGLIRYALEHVHSELAGEERTAKMTNEAIKCFQVASLAASPDWP